MTVYYQAPSSATSHRQPFTTSSSTTIQNQPQPSSTPTPWGSPDPSLGSPRSQPPNAMALTLPLLSHRCHLSLDVAETSLRAVLLERRRSSLEALALATAKASGRVKRAKHAWRNGAGNAGRGTGANSWQVVMVDKDLSGGSTGAISVGING